MSTSALHDPLHQRSKHGPIKVRQTKFKGKAEFFDLDEFDLSSLLEPWPEEPPEMAPLTSDPRAEGWKDLGDPLEDPDNLKGLPEAECDARAQPLRLSRKPKRRLPFPMPFVPAAESAFVKPWMSEPFPTDIPWDKQDPKDIICRKTDKLTMVRWEEYPRYDKNESETHDQAASALEFNRLQSSKPRFFARRFPRPRLKPKPKTVLDLLELYQTNEKNQSYEKFMLNEFHKNSFRSNKFFKNRSWEKTNEEEEGVESGGGVGGGADKLVGESEQNQEPPRWSGRGRGGSAIGLRGAFRGRGGGGGWRDGGVGRGAPVKKHDPNDYFDEETMTEEDKQKLEELGRDQYALWKKTDNYFNKINDDWSLLDDTAYLDNEEKEEKESANAS